MTPFPGAWTTLNGATMKVKTPMLHGQDGFARGLVPGQCVVEDGRFWVGTRDGCIEVIEGQFAGKPFMPVVDILRGIGSPWTPWARTATDGLHPAPPSAFGFTPLRRPRATGRGCRWPIGPPECPDRRWPSRPPHTMRDSPLGGMTPPTTMSMSSLPWARKASIKEGTSTRWPAASVSRCPRHVRRFPPLDGRLPPASGTTILGRHRTPGRRRHWQSPWRHGRVRPGPSWRRECRAVALPCWQNVWLSARPS